MCCFVFFPYNYKNRVLAYFQTRPHLCIAHQHVDSTALNSTEPLSAVAQHDGGCQQLAVLGHLTAQGFVLGLRKLGRQHLHPDGGRWGRGVFGRVRWHGRGRLRSGILSIAGNTAGDSTPFCLWVVNTSKII